LEKSTSRNRNPKTDPASEHVTDLPPQPGQEPPETDPIIGRKYCQWPADHNKRNGIVDPTVPPKVDDITARTLATAHEFGYREGYSDAIMNALCVVALLSLGIVLLMRGYRETK